MPIITVTIDSKTYRMACGKDEEAHLTALTADLSERVGRMRESFGEIGDMRLQVMAALTISDELSDLRKRFAALEAEVAQSRSVVAAAERARDEAAARAAEGISGAANRIARLADALNAPAGTAAGRRPEGGAGEP
ncbi:cell division protein ZapA [Methylobacterium sp. J-076]|uniref:cell division protein ZapA n=1 Tax=Methylobacterium sp. J-076 TaxID=2836655 RepID=UPI001FBB0ACF|nr:cell division protein ZapA [Methylobacterium sp. J-076]MCJ2012371.1 cell division protein ZapA [Methylobacterium sp. J-076]